MMRTQENERPDLRTDASPILILMRHGKAGYEGSETSDHARRLTERGRADVALMAEWLASKNLLPEIILVSSAMRTMETLACFTSARKDNSVVHTDPALYLASPARINQSLLAHQDKPGRLMIIGHNPGLHHYALHLISKAVPDDAKLGDVHLLMANLPTSALVIFERPAPADTTETDRPAWTFRQFVTPRMLKDREEDVDII